MRVSVSYGAFRLQGPHTVSTPPVTGARYTDKRLMDVRSYSDVGLTSDQGNAGVADEILCIFVLSLFQLLGD